MACKQAAMSWIFNGAGSFEKLPVQEDGPRTCHSERSEESQNECAEAKHIKIQDFSCLTTFHCNSIFALLLSFPKSLNFLLSPQTLPVSQLLHRKRSPSSYSLREYRGELKSSYEILLLISRFILIKAHSTPHENSSVTALRLCHLLYKQRRTLLSQSD